MLDAFADRHDKANDDRAWVIRLQMLRWQTLVGLLIMLGSMAGTSGCREQLSPRDLEIVASKTKPPEQDHFEIGIDFLKMRDKHNMDRSASQANYQLNRWVRGESADPHWMIDRRIINTLPDAIRRCEAGRLVLGDKSLAKLEFDFGDMLLLEEARWLHAIAKLVENSTLDESLEQWARDEAGLSGKAARQLAISQALFDWTIRNIQLEPLLDYPKSSAAGPTADSGAADPTADWPPPMLAIPGPGYTGYPWHVLMYGRGDAYQRARVFILLLRQLRIDAVMLGSDTKVGRARPWVPAVLIENELYLFDPALGLPIPGAQGTGIATLSQTIADPTILQVLSIGESYTYPTGEVDLTKIVALIDASPAYLCQRMLLVEKRLSAADQMILSVSPSDTARALRECEGITDVRLWAVPVESSIYHEAYNRRLTQDEAAYWEDVVKYGLFNQLNSLVRGRRSFLLGRFNKQGEEEGAAGYFRSARLTDATLAEIETSRRLQATMGLERPKGMPDDEWNHRLEQVKTRQVEMKQHASYWTGLGHLQQGNYDAAANWFLIRTIEKSPDGPWTEGAQYNLARCYESLGKHDEAIKLYRIDESPQRHGNLLRAIRLDK